MPAPLSPWKAYRNLAVQISVSALLLFALGQPLVASAQSVAVRDLAVLVDEAGTETIASVSAAATQQRFVPLAGALNAGYTRKVHWLRFTVPATSSPWWLEVEPAFLDDLRLFEPSATGFIEHRAGDRLPFSSRDVPYHEFIFKLKPADQAGATYFLRIQTTSSSLAILKLWQPQVFGTAITTDYLTAGVFYGFSLLALLTNIIVWLVLRKSIFGWFALFVFANTLSNLSRDGLLAQYLLPTAPLLADGIVGVSLLFFLSASVPFFWNIVGFRREQKFFQAIYRAQLVLPWLLMPSVFLDFYPEAMKIAVTCSLLTSFVPLSQMIRHRRFGDAEDLLIVLGTFLLVLGGLNAGLALLGLLPSASTAYGTQQAAYCLVILVFQVALALRLRRLDDEHQQLEATHSRLQEEQHTKDDQSRAELMEMLSQKITLLETLEQKKVELEKSEFLWRFAIEGSGDGVWDSNLQTGESSFSDRWLEIMGYTRADIPPRSDAWETLLHPEDRLRVLKAAQAYEAGETERYRVEFRMRCKNGSYRQILSRGMIVNRSTDGKPLRMIGTHTDLSPLREAEARIHHLAYYDQRTNLPNTQLFENTLGRELAAAVGGRFYGAVFFVRFANFNLLSDTRGQRCSDLLAEQIAVRLRAAVRSEDTVARRDTCDFAIIAPRLDPDENQAQAMAVQIEHRVRQIVSSPFTMEGVVHHCRLNAGISLFRYPDKVDEIMVRAGLALTQASLEGSNQSSFFQPEMQTKAEHLRSLEAELRHALQLRQFALYYQPQVNAMHQVIGAEALLRWQHPSHGLVSPDLFIGLAEETDLIIPIGLWVLQTACEQLRIWATDKQLGRLQLAVNISPKQFEQTNFVTQVQQVLASSGVDPQRLKFELTESLVLSDVPQAIAKMLQIKQLGITFAVDDFGTGSSALSYLARLPLDQIKIDKAFVHSIPDHGPADAVTRSIIAMAEGLHMAVIAEGVETAAQQETLESQGCYFYQGYLFSRPLPLPQFEEFVHHATGAPEATDISERSSSPTRPH